MKPLPNLLFVKTVAEIQEDGITKLRLARLLNDIPRMSIIQMSSQREDAITIGNLNQWICDNTNICRECGQSTAGALICGLCSSALVESQINA